MLLSEVKQILQAQVLCGEEWLDRDINTACGSDFMSDVLSLTHTGGLLLTGLVNPQVVRTADMTDMKCVIFVRGKVPGDNILRLAREREIVIMTTPERMFTSCGKLYRNGLIGEQ
jgi:predicted transcriptional regulator